MYYHFTFEKYYEEMLADGFIKPGKHRNCLPYDEKLNIGSVGDDPDYSKYIYLAKDKKVLKSSIEREQSQTCYMSVAQIS